jgi:predicted HicB family RNase H-like nuclease
MATNRRRNAADAQKTIQVLIRLQPTEKESFSECAALAGISLSAWVRERLRLAAIKELETAGRSASFVKAIPLGGFDE